MPTPALVRQIDNIASLQDSMTVVLARLDRIDATMHGVVIEVRRVQDRLGGG